MRGQGRAWPRVCVAGGMNDRGVHGRMCVWQGGMHGGMHVGACMEGCA